MMSGPNNGGPAFPLDHDHGSWRDQAPGMSLRDYFAASALQAAIIALSNFEPGLEQTRAEARQRGVTLDELLATQAYITADAMLAARQEQS